MKRGTSALARGVLAAGILLLPGTPAVAGQFHTGPDVVDDFDCDGHSDSVYLAHYYDVGDARGAGAIIVYLDTGVDQTISQNTPGVPGTAETGDSFGEVYASADFNGDGCDELVVSSPGEDHRAGMVTIINGSPNGLVPARSVAYTQNTAGVPGGSESGDEFGTTLAAGTTGSGQAYLLVGSPGEDLGSTTAAGSVYYLRGGKWRAFDQDSPGVAGSAEHWDGFGSTLAASDRYFVVGTPQEKIAGQEAAGQVHVFVHTIVDGVPDPIAAISQDTAGVSGTPEANDGFGLDVSIVSYLPSASAPIGALVAVGVPDEALGGDTYAGMAHVLAVTPDGKVTELSDVNQDTAGVSDSTQRDERFGSSIALAINGSGAAATPTTALLAVGVPDEDLSGDFDGALHVFRNMRTPGDGDVWRPNSSGRSEMYWHIDTTRTGLVPGDYDGNPGWEIPWSDILGG